MTCCVSRLPIQRIQSTLKSDFPNITFLYSELYVTDYEKSYKRSNKLLQKKETYYDDIDSGFEIIASWAEF